MGVQVANNKRRNFSAGVYRILNKENGMEYIGSTVKLKRRLNVHLWSLQVGHHSNRMLQEEWNKYGKEAFIFGVLEFVQSDTSAPSREFVSSLRALEQCWIDKSFITGKLYNTEPSAYSAKGRKLRHKRAGTDVHREIARALGKQPKTPEHRAKIAEALRGNTNGRGNANHAGRT